MIEIVKICKSYTTGNVTVKALKNISLSFGKGEFVSVCGPSGSGKTTLLNLIGGLDRYDSGDIIINGESSKNFRDSDWNAYRSRRIGFVFQNYNLIGHQSVLANVELALTIAGVPRQERRRRAKETLEKVGLGGELRKKPSQLSGGQQQRVAIARALVNDPDIVLADEPTGALDSATSVQVIDLLKEISKDRLVIMVTHNKELAEKYSTRIINLSDGEVVGDEVRVGKAAASASAVSGSEAEREQEEQKGQERGKASGRGEKRLKKPHMSLRTALSLSLRNLLTKKGRTVLTSFAGSIGIIGIALILSLQHGFQSYIDRAQEETLSKYPLTIQRTTMDSSVLISAEKDEAKYRDSDRVYSKSAFNKMFNAMQSGIHTNDLKSFKAFVESGDCKIKDCATVQYSYGLALDFYLPDTENGAVKADSGELVDRAYEVVFGQSYTEMMRGVSGMTGGMADKMVGSNMWTELLDNRELLERQYKLAAGRWPQNYDEAVLSVGRDNSISELSLYALGLKDRAEFEENLQRMKKGETLPTEQSSYSFDRILDLRCKLVLNCDLFEKENGVWADRRQDPAFMKRAVDDAMEIKVVGIIKPAEESIALSMGAPGTLGYTPALVREVIRRTEESAVVTEQKANPGTNVFTGSPFVGDAVRGKWDTMSVGEKWEIAAPYLGSLVSAGAEGAGADAGSAGAGSAGAGSAGTGSAGAGGAALSEEAKAQLLDRYGKQVLEILGSYESNLRTLGAVDRDSPQSISIYPVDFAAKDSINAEIKRYNERSGAENEIKYTDFLDLMLSTVSTIVNAVSYVLIAFVSISLIVSSIMIGVITYISVLERTKEIGVLRSIGASKRDVSRVFNAETFIVGLAAGVLGILITLLLTIPINIAINAIVQTGTVAVLPVGGAVALVAISVVLTVIAGLVPSALAAKRDPVRALRTE